MSDYWFYHPLRGSSSWTTPPLISASFKGWQDNYSIDIILASGGIYYPFLIKQDKLFLLEK